MRCPFCKFDDTVVRDSRVVAGSCVKRRRACPECDVRFTTVERVSVPEMQVVKRSGAVKTFDRAKLYDSISVAARKCGISDEMIQEAVDVIVVELQKMKGGPVHTSVIGDMAMSILRSMHKVAYVRYASVYKHFREIKDFNNFVDQESEEFV